jgi:hypothetical protein
MTNQSASWFGGIIEFMKLVCCGLATQSFLIEAGKLESGL